MTEKTEIWALGLMSGTSLDGVDGAMIRTDGNQIAELGDSVFRPYTLAEQDILREALGKWPEENEHNKTLQPAHDIIINAHIEVINQFPKAQIIGFHGQTLAHDPHHARTHQLGDGARLAQLIGKPVVWDFRSNDMVAGGQGAPLAPFFHFALARYIGRKTPLAFVNLGGVGNVSWVNPVADAPELPEALLAFDTGPANAPMNDIVYARLGQGYDTDGALALAGVANRHAVARVLQHPYFAAQPPKSLDRDGFEGVLAEVLALPTADALATLCAVCAGGVGMGAKFFPAPVNEWIICGGGRRNPALLSALRAVLAGDIKTAESVGLDGDMVEAYAFGYLAVRAMNGLPLSSPWTTGCGTPTTGGVISC